MQKCIFFNYLLKKTLLLLNYPLIYRCKINTAKADKEIKMTKLEQMRALINQMEEITSSEDWFKEINGCSYEDVAVVESVSNLKSKLNILKEAEQKVNDAILTYEAEEIFGK